ncbi:hypothetical protein Tco_0584229 [Tanacetum coccineum]
METEAIDNQANLVNYDNENENEIDDLGYQSEEYIEDAHEDDENNHSNGYAKRGITRLCKFRREYGKPGGVKLSVTFDALNRISGKHRALFSSFLGDMVREHIGLQILSWKKRYFDVDLTVKKMVKSAKAKMASSKCVFHIQWDEIEKKEIEQDEEPTRGTLWLKGRVNKDGEYQDDEIRSVGDKLVVLRRQALMQNSHILITDERYNSWQEGSSRHRSSPKDEDMSDRDRHRSSRETKGRNKVKDRGRRMVKVKI